MYGERSRANPDLKAVVFAAGRGERLWPLTETRPKHLLTLAGRPILEGTLRGLGKTGIREVLLVVNYKAEMIKSFLRGIQLGCKVSFVLQERPAGTADALRSCQPQLKGEARFIVTYGDDYYSTSGLARFVKAALRSPDDMVAAAAVEDPSRFGRLEITKGLVTSIQEKIDKTGPARVNAGLYMLSGSVFKALEKTRVSGRGEYELTDSLGLMIRGGTRVRPFSLGKEEWLGVTYPWDLLDANRMALESRSSSIAGEVEGGVQVRGPVILARGSVVKSGSYLEGPLVVGKDTTIGPNSYLRPYTSIGQNCKVGASCEVKNSVLMDHVKIPHLSYVGDSVVGEGASLGAGTVTANLRFDGAVVRSRVKGKWIDTHRRKLGTIFGDNVRTGINVSIFPGVKIGPGAWVGPGVIVSKDVASGGRLR